MAAEDDRRRPLGTVRARTTAAALGVVAAMLVAGALVLTAAVRHSLASGVERVARTRAEVVASLVRQGAPPPTLAVGGEEDALVQVVDETGRVLAASPNLQGERRISGFVPAVGATELRTLHGLPIADNGTFRVAGTTVNGPNGPVIVYAANSLRHVDDTVNALRAAFAVGVPVLLVLLGAVLWRVVGGALQPVEAIRRKVADISGGDLSHRVPEPLTADEIGRLARTMNDMLARLQQSADRQRQFVADASHELQSPLATARAVIDVAARHPETADWPAVGADVLTELDGMERLVRDLLYLSRAESPELARPLGLIDFDEVVRDEVARLQTRTRVWIDASAIEPAEVQGDREQVARVVRNLLDNAVAHAAARVTVDLRATDCVELGVADDGPGVPPEQRDRIFERFMRADPSRTPESTGSGLGLAIARAVVERHGGQLLLDDLPRGARFLVRLPLADGQGDRSRCDEE